MTQHPIVVVGARVAGAATALGLARRGHRVVVVDRSTPTRDVLSTHLLMRAGAFHLKRNGIFADVIAAETPSLATITLGFGAESMTFEIRPRFGVDAYLAPRRTTLDPIILDAAVAAGAEFRAGITVADVVRDDAGRVNGIVGTDHRGERVEIAASLVIGADGMRSRIARATGARTLLHHDPTAGVVYSYFDLGSDGHFEFRYGTDMMTGAASTNDGATLVYASVPTDRMDADPEGLLLATLDANAPRYGELVRAGERLERYRRSPGIPTFLRQAHGPGWALVGDAGFTKDPTTAHGISCAFRDAELVARAVDCAHRDPREERSAFEWYQGNRDRFASPLVRHGIELASFDWDGSGAAEHMRELGRVNDAECAWFESLDEPAAA